MRFRKLGVHTLRSARRRRMLGVHHYHLSAVSGRAWAQYRAGIFESPRSYFAVSRLRNTVNGFMQAAGRSPLL